MEGVRGRKQIGAEHACYRGWDVGSSETMVEDLRADMAGTRNVHVERGEGERGDGNARSRSTQALSYDPS